MSGRNLASAGIVLAYATRRVSILPQNSWNLVITPWQHDPNSRRYSVCSSSPAMLLLSIWESQIVLLTPTRWMGSSCVRLIVPLPPMWAGFYLLTSHTNSLSPLHLQIGTEHPPEVYKSRDEDRGSDKANSSSSSFTSTSQCSSAPLPSRPSSPPLPSSTRR